MHVIVVGVPGDKRTAAFDRALSEARREAPTRVSWDAVIDDPRCLETCGKVGDSLRIESPGSDVGVWHRLARLGGFDGARAVGEWRPGRAWFRGLTEVLQKVRAASTHLRSTHPIDHILAMTDKIVCAARLDEAGVRTPRVFSPVTRAVDFHALLEVEKAFAVYVKPRWGSSGAGVLAYRRSGGREQLTTTARLAGGRVWNHKALTTYTGSESIRTLLDLVLGDGAIVQRWVPKSGTKDGPFDLRVLVVNGRVEQRIARVGRGPITNLHLDAARLDPDVALAPFGPAGGRAVERTCLDAAACFPGHLAVAVDVMVDLEGRPWVLECNAWGDYLPNLLSGGLDSYGVQVREMFREAS